MRIKVGKISYQSLKKLLEYGYTVIFSNPEANKITGKNPKIEYKKPKMPTYIPPKRNHRIEKMYVELWKKGKLK